MLKGSRNRSYGSRKKPPTTPYNLTSKYYLNWFEQENVIIALLLLWIKLAQKALACHIQMKIIYSTAFLLHPWLTFCWGLRGKWKNKNGNKNMVKSMKTGNKLQKSFEYYYQHKLMCRNWILKLLHFAELHIPYIFCTICFRTALFVFMQKQNQKNQKLYIYIHSI